MKINCAYNRTDIEQAIALSIRTSPHLSRISRFLSYYSFVYPVTATIIGILLLMPFFLPKPFVLFLLLPNAWLAAAAGGILGGLSGGLLYRALVMRRKMIKFYLTSRLIAEPGTFEFGPQGIETKNNISESALTWDAFTQAVYDDKILLLYVGTASHFIMPRRIFTEPEWQELIGLMQEHIKIVQKIA